MFGGVVFIAVQLIIMIIVAFENCTHSHREREREKTVAHTMHTDTIE